MGTFSVPIEIGNPGGTQYESTSALAGTGAGYTVIPAALLRRLGVLSYDRAPFIVANVSLILCDVGRI